MEPTDKRIFFTPSPYTMFDTDLFFSRRAVPFQQSAKELHLQWKLRGATN